MQGHAKLRKRLAAMCKLCDSAGITDFSKAMEEAFVHDIARVLQTKANAPQSQFVFSNLKMWMMQKFDFPLFETLAAFPNPQNYYQPIFIDGEKLRTDWQGGWMRSIGFTPSGSILLFTKALQHEAFKPEADWFQYFLLVEFSPDELEIEFEPPKMILRANDVKKEGVNLLTNQKAEHTFKFSLVNLATPKSVLRADAVEQSSFYREILRRGRPEEQVAKEAKAKSDSERFVVTTLHYAPHPFMLRFFKELGYETRFAFQADAASLLEEHFRQAAAQRAPAP